MMNNITQVSPRNRVDFSKIRKAQLGIKTPNVSGITYANGTTWYGSMFSQIVGDIKNMLSNPSLTPEDKNALVQELNELQGAYAKIRATHPTLNPAQFDQKVKEYQQLIINKYNFVNTKGVTYGNNSEHQRYIYGQSDPTRRVTGDNAGKNNDWSASADGYMSGITRDRTLLGYEGDWDESSNNFQNWQNYLNGIGLETYMDTDKAYKLRLLQNQENTDSTEELNTNIESDVNQPDSQLDNSNNSRLNQTLSGDYTPDTYTKPFKFKPQPFTSPITNGIIAGLGLAANKHQYDNEMQKKVPLLEAPYHQYITGSYKGIVDAYNQAGADIQARANLIANQGSNLEQNQAIQFAGAESAANKRLEGALKQQEGYNQDRVKLLDTSYFNNDSRTNIANQNIHNLLVDYNRKLDAKSKYLLMRNSIWADNISKNRTDFGQWKASEENERDAALNAYNQYLASLDLQEAKKAWLDLASDYSKSNSFEQIYQNALRDWESNMGNNDYWKGKEDLKEMWRLANRDDAKQRQGFLTFLQTHGDSDYGKQFTQGINSELSLLKNKYIQDLQGIQNDLASIDPTFRNTYITEGWYNPNRLGRQYQRRFQKGGVLKMKHGSRFIDYLEHNRKALKDQKLTTMENAKQAQKTLQHQLEAIDRETLILLRSIFK